MGGTPTEIHEKTGVVRGKPVYRHSGGATWFVERVCFYFGVRLNCFWKKLSQANLCGNDLNKAAGRAREGVPTDACWPSSD